MKKIDFRSYTVTKPSLGMKKAIAEAEVGDDVFRDDPTTLRLESTVAELFGKEAALFVPSGTMGNQVAAMIAPLGTHIADPAERLGYVNDRTTNSKAMTDALATWMRQSWG